MFKILETFKEINKEYKRLNKKIMDRILEKNLKIKSYELLQGIRNSIFTTSGLEFESITENDLKNARYIHWPSTIRKGKEIYKEFKEDKVLKLILAIDEKLLLNRYYLLKFLFLRKEILKISDAKLIKKIYLLRMGHRLSFNSIKLLNDIKINEWLKEINKNLEKIEVKAKKVEIKAKNKDFDYPYRLSKLFKEKRSIILFFSDFLEIDVEKLYKLNNIHNNEIIPIIYRQNYDFYWLFEPFEMKKINEKTINKKIELEKFFNKAYIM